MKRLHITLIGLLLCAGVYAQELEKFNEGKKWGFLDSSGNVVVPAKYDTVHYFTEDITSVYIKGVWGFIDKSGNEVISPKYSDVVKFSEGFAAVRLNEKWGFIDKSGNEVISPKYDEVSKFSGGLAQVSLNGKWGFIDKTGEEVAADRSLPFSKPATIRITRRKSMLGAVVPYNVFINNKDVGSIKNGGTLEIPVYTSHNVVTASDGIGTFETNFTVDIEEGGHAEVYVKARRFVNK